MDNYKQPHSLSLSDRAVLNVSGVEEVLGFDEEYILLRLDGVRLLIEGEELHIGELSLEHGKVEATGKFLSFQYEESGAKRKGRRSKL